MNRSGSSVLESGLDLAGPVAPPMINGEVVFEAPWQGRLFGMACHLATTGVFSWDTFRGHLIDAIDAHPRRPYFESFLAALEAVLEQTALVDPVALRRVIDELSARPHGHDH